MIPATLVGPEVRHAVSAETGVKIPVITARGLVFMAFDPTPEERDLIAAGCPVWVVARGPFIPEMTLRVGEQNEVIPFDLRVSAVKENVPGGDEAARAVEAYAVTDFDRRMGKVLMWGAASLACLILIGIGACVAR